MNTVIIEDPMFLEVHGNPYERWIVKKDEFGGLCLDKIKRR